MSSLSTLLFFRTIADIGPRRIIRRLRYEIRKYFDRSFHPFVVTILAGTRSSVPSWSSVLQCLKAKDVHLPIPIRQQSFSFSFLHLEHQFSWPFSWNDPTWPRLWQFNLHYFDWAREWLEFSLIYGEWPDESSILEPLIDHWIQYNHSFYGDGWHSYTLSLRCRNWIWLFRCYPTLATPHRIQSLWQQLRWLQSHPEHANGGNHWLENLTAIALCALQFDGYQATSMHHRAMLLLEEELSSQILPDGGHEERSASYHILMLDRLVELACVIADIKSERPIWLVNAIDFMASWLRAVRFEGGIAPRFNDSAPDAAPHLDVVLCFADAYLQQRTACSGLRSMLLKASAASQAEFSPLRIPVIPSSSPVVTDLPSTGLTILRPGHAWELVFKCGQPCPLHLPGHVHSDQLSFELCFQGKWILSEAGTSTYSSGPERSYERSGAAHNLLQLGQISPSGSISWVEPVEVWGAFRAARKARPLHRHSGTFDDGSCFASGSHDGFNSIGANHLRRVQFRNARPNHIEFILDDTISTIESLYFRQWWHLAPGIPDKILDTLQLEATTAESIKSTWHCSWFSEGFGQRISRKSFCISGRLPPGDHLLRITLPLSASLL